MEENALISTRGYKKSTAKCDECGRIGHRKETCYKIHPELRPKRGGNRADSQAPAEALTSKTEETGISDVLITNTALSVKHSSDKWILDFGATLYICCDVNLFDSIAPTSSRIAWGNASNLPASGIGAITVKLPNSAKVILESVLYIPELELNLVSLSRIMQKGATISFAKNRAEIQLKSGAELQATMDSQGLFYIPFSADIQYTLATTIPDQAQLWH